MCIRDRPLTRRLVQFRLNNPDVRIYHDEPISRNGVRVGYTTSASFGHAIGASVGMGYVSCNDGVTKEWIDAGTWMIEVASKECSAQAQLAGFYDPKGTRMRDKK